MQYIFLSFHGKYKAAAAVPVLVMILFLMVYKMVMSISLYLCSSWSQNVSIDNVAYVLAVIHHK